MTITWHAHRDSADTLCGLDLKFGTKDLRFPIWGRLPDSMPARLVPPPASRHGTYCRKCLKILDARTIGAP